MSRPPPGAPARAPGRDPRRLALDVLERVLHGAYLAPALSEALDASELEGPDRSLVTDLAYGVVRRLPQLDHALAPHLAAPGKLPPRLHGALRLGAYELLYRGTPAYAAVSAWVGVAKRETPRLAGLVNAVLRRVRPLGAEAPREVRAGLPAWLLADFEEALGAEHAFAAAQAMLEPEPLWLTALDPGAVEALRAEGAEVEPLRLPVAGPGGGGAGAERRDEGADVERLPEGAPPPPASLRVRAGMPLDRTDAYRRGLVQPQNPSSLQAALLLGAGAGDAVYDLAAGRGVKSAVLAKAGARVTAFELSPQRSRAAARNLGRLGLEVEHEVANLLEVPDAPPANHVILDAPCSGTGTLRGHPEIKLRVTAEQVAELADLQRRLLATAAALVAPGGVLVYAVCALTLAEGAEVVGALLAERPEFTAEPFALPLPSVEPAGGGVGRYVLPQGGLDGFYLARLRRD